MSSPRVSRVLGALLCLCLLPRPLRSAGLRCFYSPLQEREQEARVGLEVTECPPQELCFKGVGRYGNHSALSTRGCMLAQACGRRRVLRRKGTAYLLSYTCCPRAYCNAAGPPARPLGLTLAAGLLAARWAWPV